MKLRDISAIIPTREPKHQKKPSRFAAWRSRMSHRMARSSRVFLLGLVFACGIEVLVDWIQTLSEINVLRNAVRLKGESYVGILSKASDDELATRDRAGLNRVSEGIFDDEDAIYVRFSDPTGKVVWDKLKDGFAETFRQRGFGVFAEQYSHLMRRDSIGIINDPGALKARVAGSRYKDFAQRWTDATGRLIALVVPPKPVASARDMIVYEDRLRDENREKDDKISYVVAAVLGDDGRNIGTVIVAFDMKHTNDAIRVKYLKFAGLVVFFVALILVQNTVSRKNKLRLLELERRYSAAKKAIRDAMPAKEFRCGTLVASGHVEQAKGLVDGMMWNAVDEGNSLLVLVVDPDGDGIDAATTGLVVARTFLNRRRDGAEASLDDELRALAEAASSIPLARPIAALLLRVDLRTGVYQALTGSFATIHILAGMSVETIELDQREIEASDGVVGPLFQAKGVLEAGRSIVGICSNHTKKEAKTFADTVTKSLARRHGPGKKIAIEDTAFWARSRNAALAENDIAIVAVTREG